MRNNRYRKHVRRRVRTAQDILNLIPSLPYRQEERVLVALSCKLGDRGKPLFDVDALSGATRWDRVKDAVRRGVEARGPRLTTNAVKFAVQTAIL